MGCAKSKEPGAAARPPREAQGQRSPGSRSSAKDHLPSQALPENAATGVSGPCGPSSTATADPMVRLWAYIDSHPVVSFSHSMCKRCAEGTPSILERITDSQTIQTWVFDRYFPKTK